MSERYALEEGKLAYLNPLTPRWTIIVLFDQKFNFLLRRDHQTISYERSFYESVDDKSLPLIFIAKTD